MLMKNTGTKTGRKINIVVPFLKKNKSEIIKIGQKLRVPFEITWSCYAGKKKPCGKCDSCFYRNRGFERLGLKDPAV